jgi:formate dehydrogenase subunit delta
MPHDSRSATDRAGPDGVSADAGGGHANKVAKLVRMANQIGEFYAAMPEAEAIDGAAKHLRLYWTPKMIRELAAFAEAGGAGLNPTASRALESLKPNG